MLVITFFESCLCVLPAERRRDRAPGTPSRGWRTTPSAKACSSHSTAGSHTWCCCLRTEPPQSARWEEDHGRWGQKSVRQHYFTNSFLGQLSLDLEQQISVSISASCLPLGCPSFCPQLPFLLSGSRSSLCRLCLSCCYHIPAPPYCLNTSSTPPVRKRKTEVIFAHHLVHRDYF